jgi:hypothetical protein
VIIVGLSVKSAARWKPFILKSQYIGGGQRSVQQIKVQCSAMFYAVSEGQIMQPSTAIVGQI